MCGVKLGGTKFIQTECNLKMFKLDGNENYSHVRGWHLFPHIVIKLNFVIE